MKLTLIGATHEVTGSCTLLETGNQRILIDCGMEQGADMFENQEIPFAPGEIDCVLLTHAHIDHSGKLPLLTKNGFSGPIYTTEATANLCRIMLMDSAHIQEFEAEWKSRKAQRSGEPPVPPMYDSKDAEAAIACLRPCAYQDKIQISETVEIRFSDMGHLLGSAAIEIWITEGDLTKKLVCSGDVGNKNQPLLNDPQKIDEADYLLLESTYGGRFHGSKPDYITLLADILQRAFDRGGNVVIPSFAVGRTQELLYFIRQIKNEDRVHGHDHFPVYVDSPLANEATGIFLQCDPAYFDGETKALLSKGVNPIWFPDLKTAVSAEESKAINTDERPKVILSASGMCEAGRIRHHLKHNLWKPENLILFVGYQAVGTMGRALYEGAKTVKLFGETVAVNAEITVLPGISGHADQDGLLEFVGGFTKKPKLIFVNHGDDATITPFCQTITDTYQIPAVAPYSGSCYDLATGECLTETMGIPVVKTGERTRRARTIYDRLVAAAQRLLKVAKDAEGQPNKELSRFTDQLNNLADRWSR